MNPTLSASNRMSLRARLNLNIKNAVLGVRTSRKIVVFDIDDYGNVRIHSSQARANLDKAGLKAYSRFDEVDCLETNDDFDALFAVLRSVKDKNGNPAKFTAFALPANINFEAMAQSQYQEYIYELLPETLDKLGPDFNNVMNYWYQGMQDGLIHPEFHGREHFHVRLIMEKLKRKDHEVITCFQNRSLARLSPGPLKNISWSFAFDFQGFSELEQHAQTIVDGLQAFHKVFKIHPTVFCAPGSSSHPVLFDTACQNGIRFIESRLLEREHQGEGRFKRRFNYTGKTAATNGRHIVRNCVFEPNEPMPFDWVTNVIRQIEVAFRWHKPAIISSHRANFCGHIDEKNRKNGLGQLQELLQQIVRRWPDVEFMSTPEMAHAIGL